MKGKTNHYNIRRWWQKSPFTEQHTT